MSKRLWAAAAAVLLLAPLSARAQVLDLTNPANTTPQVFGGATWQVNFDQSTGTGVYDPFVRMQASNNTFESGFNTDTNKNSTLDDLNSNHTHSLLFSSLMAESIAGINGGAPVYVFSLDANQTNQNGGLPDAGLSLLQLQIYSGNSASPGFGTTSFNGFNLFTGFDPSVNPQLVYNLDAGSNRMVNLNTGINNGSGSGDLTVFIDKATFDSLVGGNQYIYLYSSFGTPDPNGQISGDLLRQQRRLRGVGRDHREQ
jgi:hypothetical protein